MIINSKIENEALLNINNDIYRIMIGLNKIDDFKRLLISTDYNTTIKQDLSIDLLDNTIVRIPLIPITDTSVCAITINQVALRDNTYYTQLNIDIYTPNNQWIVKEGIRPLLLCSYVKNFMKTFNQTMGVKYRLSAITNCSLGSDINGYRLTYNSVIDK